jgi:hypothetical protein
MINYAVLYVPVPKKKKVTQKETATITRGVRQISLINPSRFYSKKRTRSSIHFL